MEPHIERHIVNPTLNFTLNFTFSSSVQLRELYMAGDYLERSLGIKREVHGEHHMKVRLSFSISVSSQTCFTTTLVE